MKISFKPQFCMTHHFPYLFLSEILFGLLILKLLFDAS